MTVREALRAGWATLAQAGIPSPALDAELLLAFVRAQTRTALLADDRAALTDDALSRYTALTARRTQREPLAYLTGEKEFFGRAFTVTPAVLIPRSASELLVETALAQLQDDAPKTVADIGTGSGCLAVSLAFERPMVRVIATDISPDALNVARRNIERHSVADRCILREGDLLQPVADDALDLIVANLPYVPNEEVAENPDLAFEPLLALRGAQTPERTYERFLEQWFDRSDRPPVLLEIHPRLASFIIGWCAQRSVPCTITKDLAGQERLAVLSNEP